MERNGQDLGMDDPRIDLAKQTASTALMSALSMLGAGGMFNTSPRWPATGRQKDPTRPEDQARMAAAEEKRRRRGKR